MFSAKKKGTEALTTFVEDSLLLTSKCFFGTLSKLKLGNFTNVKKSSSLSKEGKTVILRADRNLFARLLVIGQSRELLVHELGPLPWSLASFDGSLAKTNKAALLKLLEDGVNSLHHLPAQTSAVIIDAMAILQMLSQIPDRFFDLAEMVFNTILLQAGEATRVDFVGDQYPHYNFTPI